MLKDCQQAAERLLGERGRPEEAAGNGPSYFHSLSPFMEMLLVPVQEEKIQEVRARERIPKEAEAKEKVCRSAAFTHFPWKSTCSLRVSL